MRQMANQRQGGTVRIGRIVICGFCILVALFGQAEAQGSKSLEDEVRELRRRLEELEDKLRESKSEPAPVEASAEEPEESADPEESEESEKSEEPTALPEGWTEALSEYLAEQFPVRASYGSKGFRLETRDGKYQTNLQWRFQFRLSDPNRSDPRQVDQFEERDETTFELRRVRMKIGGHGYEPWLKYYFEVDLQPTRDVDDSSPSSGARVIDWRVDVEKWKWLSLRVGQWKIDYNRERVDSSGRQQFVERSIVNRIFTIDRQMGVSLRGHLFEETPADLRYAFGAFTGEGRGASNDDNNLMYTGRLQWNFLGRDLAFRQTDVERTELPTGSLAIAGATHTGRPTRWSSGGGGNLDGFARPGAAEDGEFRIYQSVVELAYKWQGFSFQNEWHWKQITDRELAQEDPAREVDLWGVYAQTGYFFNEIFDWYPEPLELAFRYAWLQEPNETARNEDNERAEYTVAANWFFAGHNNKITLDYSYLTLDDSVLRRDPSDHRFRLQWDISF